QIRDGESPAIKLGNENCPDSIKDDRACSKKRSLERDQQFHYDFVELQSLDEGADDPGYGSNARACRDGDHKEWLESSEYHPIALFRSCCDDPQTDGNEEECAEPDHQKEISH